MVAPEVATAAAVVLLAPRATAPALLAVAPEPSAFVAWFAGLKHLEAGTVGLIGLLNPVTGVLVGRGRDYTDVAPLRGVYAGPFGSELFVNVEITREY